MKNQTVFDSKDEPTGRRLTLHRDWDSATTIHKNSYMISTALSEGTIKSEVKPGKGWTAAGGRRGGVEGGGQCAVDTGTRKRKLKIAPC
jgi:hypothetical protein